MPKGVYERQRVSEPEQAAPAARTHHTGVVLEDVRIAVRSQVLHYRAGQTIHADPDVKALAADAGARIDWED